MLVIGLTGGIGSGKSTVARLFEKKGIPIIDADVIAQALTLPGQPALQAIIEHFNDPALMRAGQLNRARLREIIFQLPGERLWLEQLLHPLIRKQIETQIKAIVAPYCIVVIPLLAESGAYDFINRILVIDTNETEQIKRAAQRDRVPPEQIAAILKTQASREARLGIAHDIIQNNGTLDDLIPQVERWHQHYLSLI
jgi:dephospho-CoA kinase